MENRDKSQSLDVSNIGDTFQSLVRSLQILEKSKVTNHGFTVSQFYTLFNLRKSKKLSMKDLSLEMNLDTSTMTRVVNNLIRDGYMERNRLEEDRRVVIVMLTQKGEDKVNEIYRNLMESYQYVVDQLPKDKQLQVVDSMKILLSVLDKIDLADF